MELIVGSGTGKVGGWGRNAIVVGFFVGGAVVCPGFNVGHDDDVSIGCLLAVVYFGVIDGMIICGVVSGVLVAMEFNCEQKLNAPSTDE